MKPNHDPAARELAAHLTPLLRERLIQVLALDPEEPFTRDSAWKALIGCSEAVCCRWPRAGGRVLKFREAFELVYDEKVDVRRLLLTNEKEGA